jgi:hypothetical protein
MPSAATGHPWPFVLRGEFQAEAPADRRLRRDLRAGDE